MTYENNPRFFVLGGISGIVGTLCYVLAGTVEMNPTVSYAVAMAWPLLSIVFVFSLNRFLGLDRPSAANDLACILACLAFTLVAAMLSIQLAVKMGIEEYLAAAAQADQEPLKVIRRSIRLVDLGIDVAWDIFMGIALLFLATVLNRHRSFGRWWALPLALLSTVVIVLNVLTFPWPPDTRNLFDIGPLIGVFIIALSARLFFLGRRADAVSTPLRAGGVGSPV